MTIYLLPTKSPVKYSGKYPNSIRHIGWDQGRNMRARALAVYLCQKRCIHIELYSGRRFIIDEKDLLPGQIGRVGADFWSVVNQARPQVELSQEVYDIMRDYQEAAADLERQIHSNRVATLPMLPGVYSG